MSKQQKEQQLLETVDRIIAEGPYQPAWSSLMQAKTPDWFKQKRFGIFIHWGVYSVPANSNEWYPNDNYTDGNTHRDCQTTPTKRLFPYQTHNLFWRCTDTAHKAEKLCPLSHIAV